MHYPWWHVPFLTSPMIIALVAVVHVLVSHYAVGGGLFLAAETRFAYQTSNTAYLAYLRSHTRFFVLLTVVFGAITGVGIWWTIGLASPLATEVLIHTFVFGWAMEYVFFIVEITSAFAFYYYWGRLPAKTHERIGWIYAFSAWVSLVLITGITAFMLNAGRWPEERTFWIAFFNPQFLPQVVARTGGSLLLACLYVYLHTAFTVKDPGLRNLIEVRSARPALLGSVLIVIGGIGWYLRLPNSAQAALTAASVLNVLMVLLFTLTVVVFVMLYFGPYRNPGWLSPGFAILFFAFGLAALTIGEYIREAVRKPYVVYNVVLSNQVLPEELPALRADGLLERGAWTRAFVAMEFPNLLRKDGRIDSDAFAALAEGDRIRLGELLFQYACSACHAAQLGFSPVGHLTRGWTPAMLLGIAEHPERYHFFMPPWPGTAAEADLLKSYLLSAREEYPKGMNYPVENGNGARH